MTETSKAIGRIRDASQVYSQSLALIRPLFEGQPNVPRYVIKRVGIRLLECAGSEGDALLGVSLSRVHKDSVAEHCLKVGIVIANLVNYLALARQDRLDAVLAGLLHHIGQDVTGALSRSPGVQSQRSLMSLLLVPNSDKGHYRQVLAAFQHQLGLDGTGEPRMDFPVRQHPMSHILTVANDFVELTSAARGSISGNLKTGPLLPGPALATMRKGSGSRYHPALLGVLDRVVGPCPVGSFLKLHDGRMVVVIHFEASDSGWSAVAVDVTNPTSSVHIDQDSADQIQGLVESSQAFAAVGS